MKECVFCKRLLYQHSYKINEKYGNKLIPINVIKRLFYRINKSSFYMRYICRDCLYVVRIMGSFKSILQNSLNSDDSDQSQLLVLEGFRIFKEQISSYEYTKIFPQYVLQSPALIPFQSEINIPEDEFLEPLYLEDYHDRAVTPTSLEIAAINKEKERGRKRAKSALSNPYRSNVKSRNSKSVSIDSNKSKTSRIKRSKSQNLADLFSSQENEQEERLKYQEQPKNMLSCCIKRCLKRYSEFKDIQAHILFDHKHDEHIKEDEYTKKVEEYWESKNRFIKEPIEEYKYPCLISTCNKFYQEFDLLNEHKIKDHNNLATFYCPECNKKMTSEEDFQTHNKIKHVKNLTKCILCSDTLENILELQKHLRSHQNRNVICMHCGYTFENRKYLEEHQKVHTEIKIILNHYNSEKNHSSDQQSFQEPVKSIVNIRVQKGNTQNQLVFPPDMTLPSGVFNTNIKSSQSQRLTYNINENLSKVISKVLKVHLDNTSVMEWLKSRERKEENQNENKVISPGIIINENILINKAVEINTNDFNKEDYNSINNQIVSSSKTTIADSTGENNIIESSQNLATKNINKRHDNVVGEQKTSSKEKKHVDFPLFNLDSADVETLGTDGNKTGNSSLKTTTADSTEENNIIESSQNLATKNINKRHDNLVREQETSSKGKMHVDFPLFKLDSADVEILGTVGNKTGISSSKTTIADSTEENNIIESSQNLETENINEKLDNLVHEQETSSKEKEHVDLPVFKVDKILGTVENKTDSIIMESIDDINVVEKESIKLKTEKPIVLDAFSKQSNVEKVNLEKDPIKLLADNIMAEKLSKNSSLEGNKSKINIDKEQIQITKDKVVTIKDAISKSSNWETNIWKINPDKEPANLTTDKLTVPNTLSKSNNLEGNASKIDQKNELIKLTKEPLLMTETLRKSGNLESNSLKIDVDKEHVKLSTGKTIIGGKTSKNKHLESNQTKVNVEIKTNKLIIADTCSKNSNCECDESKMNVEKKSIKLPTSLGDKFFKGSSLDSNKSKISQANKECEDKVHKTKPEINSIKTKAAKKCFEFTKKVSLETTPSALSTSSEKNSSKSIENTSIAKNIKGSSNEIDINNPIPKNISLIDKKKLFETFIHSCATATPTSSKVADVATTSKIKKVRSSIVLPIVATVKDILDDYTKPGPDELTAKISNIKRVENPTTLETKSESILLVEENKVLSDKTPVKVGIKNVTDKMLIQDNIKMATNKNSSSGSSKVPTEELFELSGIKDTISKTKVNDEKKNTAHTINKKNENLQKTIQKCNLPMGKVVTNLVEMQNFSSSIVTDDPSKSLSKNLVSVEPKGIINVNKAVELPTKADITSKKNVINLATVKSKITSNNTISIVEQKDITNLNEIKQDSGKPLDNIKKVLTKDEKEVKTVKSKSTDDMVTLNQQVPEKEETKIINTIKVDSGTIKNTTAIMVTKDAIQPATSKVGAKTIHNKTVMAVPNLISKIISAAPAKSVANKIIMETPKAVKIDTSITAKSDKNKNEKGATTTYKEISNAIKINKEEIMKRNDKIIESGLAKDSKNKLISASGVSKVSKNNTVEDTTLIKSNIKPPIKNTSPQVDVTGKSANKVNISTTVDKTEAYGGLRSTDETIGKLNSTTTPKKSVAKSDIIVTTVKSVVNLGTDKISCVETMVEDQDKIKPTEDMKVTTFKTADKNISTPNNTKVPINNILGKDNKKGIIVASLLEGNKNNSETIIEAKTINTLDVAKTKTISTKCNIRKYSDESDICEEDIDKSLIKNIILNTNIPKTSDVSKDKSSLGNKTAKLNRELMVILSPVNIGISKNVGSSTKQDTYPIVSKEVKSLEKSVETVLDSVNKSKINRKRKLEQNPIEVDTSNKKHCIEPVSLTHTEEDLKITNKKMLEMFSNKDTVKVIPSPIIKSSKHVSSLVSTSPVIELEKSNKLLVSSTPKSKPKKITDICTNPQANIKGSPKQKLKKLESKFNQISASTPLLNIRSKSDINKEKQMKVRVTRLLRNNIIEEKKLNKLMEMEKQNLKLKEIGGMDIAQSASSKTITTNEMEAKPSNLKKTKTKGKIEPPILMNIELQVPEAEVEVDIISSTEIIPAVQPPPKRKRGRPRKIVEPQVVHQIETPDIAKQEEPLKDEKLETEDVALNFPTNKRRRLGMSSVVIKPKQPSNKKRKK